MSFKLHHMKYELYIRQLSVYLLQFPSFEDIKHSPGVFTCNKMYPITEIWNKFFITGRNKVVAKVMFLLVSVILLTGGICLSACWDTPPGRKHPSRKGAPLGRKHPHGIQSMSGRYASYWSAFLY